MSKLLIPGHGAPSAKVNQPGGGLVLAPDASRIASMRYGIKGGCMPYGLSTAAGTADNNIIGLFFPTTNNTLFSQSIAAQTLAMTRLTGAKGLLLTGDDNDHDGQHLSPYYDNGTISSDKEEGINSFTVGTASEFYMKATFETSSITGNDFADVFIGFASAEANDDEPNTITEGYGFKIGEDHDDATAGLIVEQSSTASTATFTTTGVAMVAATPKEIEIKVSAAGVASLLLDGVVKTTATGKTFTSGTVLRPLITIVEAGQSETLHLAAFEFGHTNARK